jgi:hypothetical protein
VLIYIHAFDRVRRQFAALQVRVGGDPFVGKARLRSSSRSGSGKLR